MSTAPTHAIVLTAPGRSAIAVVEVSGPSATAAVDACFAAANGKRLADQPIAAIRFGRWRSDSGNGNDEKGDGEELIVCRTNDTTVEVHCHGGVAAVQAVVDSLVREGCVPIDWREHTRHSVSNTIEAEARIALADCVTDRAAAVLIDQFEGALAGEVDSALALLDAGDVAAALEVCQALLGRSPCGLHLTEPWRVVLAGPPNVGKSSLINRLVGYERAVVYDQPGVTRDVVTAAAAIDGWPVALSDTAGLRAPSDELEAAGVALTRDAAGAADLVILVEAHGLGGTAGQALGSDELLDRLGLGPLTANQRLLRVANKADLAGGLEAIGPAGSEAIAVSAATGAGVDALVAAIGQTLVPHPPAAGAGVPFLARHADRLAEADAALAAEDAATTRAALQSLLAPAAVGNR